MRGARARNAFAALALLGCGGGGQTVATDGADTYVAPVPASVVIDEPLAGALVAGPSVRIAGHVEGAATEVLVEGLPVPVVLGRFETTVVREDGPGSASVALGSGATAEVAFEVDS